MPDELKEHLILRELDDNRSWMQELFKQLVGWYTFFVTANIAVMSWLVTRKDGEPLGVLPWLMMLLNICAVVMVALSWLYLMVADSRSRVLITRLNRLAQLEDAEALRSVFPRKIMSMGLLFLVIGLLALTVAWKTLPGEPNHRWLPWRSDVAAQSSPCYQTCFTRRCGVASLGGDKCSDSKKGAG